MSPEKSNLEMPTSPVISPEKEPMLLQAADNAASIIKKATEPAIRTFEELMDNAHKIMDNEAHDKASMG